MAKPLELFALVQMTPPSVSDLMPTIQKIVRTYEDKERARQDMELITELNPHTHLSIVTVAHID